MSKLSKQYNARDARKVKETGFVSLLVRAEDEDLDPAGGPWVAICNEHKTLCNHTTRAHAVTSMRWPWNFCEECAAIVDYDTLAFTY